MYKKTITYEDFDNNVIEEDFYFNLTNTEIAKMSLEVPGGLDSFIVRITQSRNIPELAKIFSDLIDRSYGVRSLDGKGFYKRKEDLEAFKASNAYDKLYMELATSDEAAVAFFKGIVPKDVASNLPDKYSGE